MVVVQSVELEADVPVTLVDLVVSVGGFALDKRRTRRRRIILFHPADAMTSSQDSCVTDQRSSTLTLDFDLKKEMF